MNTKPVVPPEYDQYVNSQKFDESFYKEFGQRFHMPSREETQEEVSEYLNDDLPI